MGNLGEDVACKFLVSKGFVVLARNYQKKWGEIDIIARKDTDPQGAVPAVHFFEVKSVSADWRGHSPEENVHSLKTRHIRRMIETYLTERKGVFSRADIFETPFQFHVLCVYLNMQTHRATVKWLQNIVL